MEINAYLNGGYQIGNSNFGENLWVGLEWYGF